MSFTGRTFTFKDVITMPEAEPVIVQSDTANPQTIITLPLALESSEYVAIGAFPSSVLGQEVLFVGSVTDTVTLWTNGVWIEEAYKTIQFVGEPTSFYPSEEVFMTWLLANATEVVGASPLSEFEAPDGSEYYFKDAQARTDIADLKDNQYSSSSAFPASGEVGKIYIAKDTNETYRWDSTTSDYVLIGSAGGGGSLLYILSFSILTTDWESITGGYGASITDSHVGTATDEIVVFDDSLTDLNANIFWEKNGSTHTMTFTSSSIPSDTISGKVFVFGDASGDVAYALPAVTSSDNGKVLGVVDGAWAVMTIPSANGVSF